MIVRLAAIVVVLGLAAGPSRAQGPAASGPAAEVRRIPKAGIEVSESDREELRRGLGELGDAIGRLEGKKDAKVEGLLPDVRIFQKAVRDALEYREFFEEKELARAKGLLKEGRARAEQLERGEAPWATKKGLVVRGYVSRIDGSVQPYGLVVPESYTAETAGRYRLDIWFHGRGETLGEVNFLDERMRNPGTFAPADAIVLHPYGRYCNAFKFAGEVDAMEALEDVRGRYRVDEDRVLVRGFSMGGAACWHFAVHHADRWCAANPGAGFAETAEFLKLSQKEEARPPDYEQKLWRLYDCPGYARNLFQCPTVAYSGEEDRQKQAADVMAAALEKEGIDLLHVVGPKTKHSYHPDAKREVESRLASIAGFGRTRLPSDVSLVTYTLKYNRMNWVTIDALGEHWERADVEASVTENGISLEAHNVSALTLDFPPGSHAFGGGPVSISGEDWQIDGPNPKSDGSWRCELHKEGVEWKVGPAPGDGPRKRHDLQGPIDDAFMDSFVFVRPTGAGKYPKVRAWADAELARAVERWRRHFRGEPRVKDDTAVTDADIASSHLVLWGDPDGNAVLRRVADKLPIGWKGDRLTVGAREFAAEDHAPILIYPNPLNPSRYVVVNSGFTYRDADDRSNARQTPKLPDWAVIDVRTPPDERSPGKVAAADFFGESWELRPPRE